MKERLTIYLDDNSIRAGSIEKVKRVLDPIVDNSAVVRRYEAGVSLAFGSPGERRLGFFEMERRLSDAAHKRWFRALDGEIAGLPDFLADDEEKRSLLIFLMGVHDYRIQKTRVVFDPTNAARFFRDKKALIQNFCLSHNIDPTPSIKRLAGILCPGADGRTRAIEAGPEQIPLFSRPDSAAAVPASVDTPAAAAPVSADTPAAVIPALADTPAEVVPSVSPSAPSAGTATVPPVASPKAEDAQPLRGLLDRFGSIAVFKENRMTKLFLVFDDIPAHLTLVENELRYDPSRGQWRFATVFRTETGERTVDSLLLYRSDEVAESIKAHGGVLIVCIHRNDEGDYQKLFELDEPVPTAIVQEAAPAPEPPAEELRREAASDAAPPPPAEPSAPVPAPERSAPPPPEPSADAEDPRDRRIAELEAEVTRLKKLVEAYEESLAKKQRFSIFKKFFG